MTDVWEEDEEEENTIKQKLKGKIINFVQQRRRSRRKLK